MWTPGKGISQGSVSDMDHEDGASDASSEIPDIATIKDLPVRPDFSTATITAQSRPLGLSRLWGLSNYDDYDVITVHGLRDDQKTVWQSQTGKLWLRDHLFVNLSVRQLDYFYAIEEDAEVYGPGGIKKEAQNLLRLYREQRQSLPDTEVDRPIIWVCHDIGGTIVKQVLIEAAQAVMLDDYEDIAAWNSAKEIHHKIATFSTAVIFLGCPHKSESLEVLQDEILNLMSLPGPAITKGRVGRSNNIACQVEEINRQFLRSKLFHRVTIISVFHLAILPDNAPEDHSKDALVAESAPTDNADDSNEKAAGLDDQSHLTSSVKGIVPALPELPLSDASPFSQYAMTTFSPLEGQSRFPVWIEHLDLVRALKVDQAFIRAQTALLAVVPPMRTPTIHMEPRLVDTLPAIEWIGNQDIYKALDTKLGPQILHIQCNEQESARVSMLTQHLYTKYEYDSSILWWDDPKGRCFYFEFVRSDNRYNNIRSMLLTFINQAAWHYSLDSNLHHIQKMLAQLQDYGSWSLPHLFQLFSTFRSWTDAAGVVIFLACFDDCVEEERRWFLEALKEDQARGDINYCLVFTTKGPDEISSALIDRSQVLSLQNCPMPFLGYSIDEEGNDDQGLTVALERAIKKRPALGTLKGTLSNLLEQCRSSPYLGYVILRWLSNSSRGTSLTEVTATVTRLSPLTAENILNVFLELLSRDKRDWALQVYRWVRFSKEPLTVTSLGQALAACSDPKNTSKLLLEFEKEYFIQELETGFSGIIVVDGDEVKFSHNSFNQPVPNFDDSEDEQPSQIHGFIAKACLRYMMQDCVQKEYARLSPEGYGGDIFKTPLVLREGGFLEYAIQFWVYHYQLADNHRPLDLASQFFRTKAFRDKWAEGCYLLSNPFTRTHQSYCSSLPLMASLGLDDMLSSQVNEEKNSDWFQKDAWLAIVEAARNGHERIVRDLLDLVEIDRDGLRDAMASAATVQNEDIIAQLLDKVASLKSFPWTQSLLSRAASTGSKSLVLAIAKHGFDLSSVDEVTDQTALHAAILWGQRAIVEVLLSFDVDLSILQRHSRDMTPLTLAIEMADPQIVQMLLDKGARVDGGLSDGELITTRAAGLGHHMVLERLLSAGAQFQVGADDTDTTAPITRAIRDERMGCIRLLLKHTADPHGKSSDGSLLYQSCKIKNGADICRILLEKGADPNECYPDKEMLLIAALRTDSKEMIDLLIDNGAKIDSLDKWEDGDARTPLSFAASECSIDILELLLDRGADVNYVPEGSRSPLFITALRTLHTEKLELLLKRGASIEWKRDDGWRALHAAYDAPKIIKLLLDHGADVNSIWGYKETLELLVGNPEWQPDLDLRLTYDPEDDKYGYTAVRLAAEGGHYDCASLLLESGAQLDDKMRDAKFFLGIVDEALSEEQSKALDNLIEQCFERGTKANILDGEQNTALHHVSKFTPVSLVLTLLGMGAPIDSPNADGWTPLAVALKVRNAPVAKFLLVRGVKTDLYGPKFGSLFHVICDSQTYGIFFPLLEVMPLMKRLIKQGADANMPGPEPGSESLLYTVVHCLPAHICEIITRYLVEEVKMDVNSAGRAKRYPVIAAICKLLSPVVQYLIRHGADLDVADDQGLRPIHHAAMQLRQSAKPLPLVRRHCSELQPKDIYDRTPLHFASASGNWPATRRFIDGLPQGFDANIKDCDGWTPLMWACRSVQGGETIEKLIRDHKADIWTVSNDGQWSPLKLANFTRYGDHLTGLLMPPNDKMERVLEDGSTQIWEPDFHKASPGKHHFQELCNSCIVPIIGPIYRCVDCQARFQLCFKCFPHRKRMHDPTHELEEFQTPESVVLEDDEQSDSNEAGDDDDDEDGDTDGDEDEDEDDDEDEDE
ncbi:ankyrin repeat-containing domain protein [Fusarium flagelliforme]|uniref:ankyrin repeat-containing domain protein n=1 Tax=Fusarium flagelliforme TaxID=2675880 RepID=UPI001E8EE884|nr:ankyrin repeat-containing domain protein [Fusarium flagelliforme]KAH7186028.1 ankyrin repeat-containing domain protein [Fusarium flagelliforme]